MTYDFRGLPPATDAVPRPVLDVGIAHDDDTTVTALCDSGALHNRFGAWLADVIGLDLTGIEPVALGVGGQHMIARTATVRLRLGDIEWEAPVGFCQPWPWPCQLLGQEGFFRWFDVTLRTADRPMDIALIDS